MEAEIFKMDMYLSAKMREKFRQQEIFNEKIKYDLRYIAIELGRINTDIKNFLDDKCDKKEIFKINGTC